MQRRHTARRYAAWPKTSVGSVDMRFACLALKTYDPHARYCCDVEGGGEGDGGADVEDGLGEARGPVNIQHVRKVQRRDTDHREAGGDSRRAPAILGE